MNGTATRPIREKKARDRDPIDRNYVQLVAKTLRVLEALADHADGAGLKDIAAATGLGKSSAFRILYTLRTGGYVEPAGSGAYRLTLKMLALTRRFGRRPTLTGIARPYLVGLRDRLHESAWLAELRHAAVVLVDGVEAAHQLQLSLGVGSICPLHAAAVGKAIAAHLPERRLQQMLGAGKLPRYTRHTIASRAELWAELARVRREGHAINEEETIEGAMLVAAPIFDAGGRAFAAISVSAVVGRCPPAKRKAITEAVKQAVQSISRELKDLGFHLPPVSRSVPQSG